jgi:hypothetical protein
MERGKKLYDISVSHNSGTPKKGELITYAKIIVCLPLFSQFETIKYIKKATII